MTNLACSLVAQKYFEYFPLLLISRNIELFIVIIREEPVTSKEARSENMSVFEDFLTRCFKIGSKSGQRGNKFNTSYRDISVIVAENKTIVL